MPIGFYASGVMAAVYALCVIVVWNQRVNANLRWAITLFCGGGAINFVGGPFIVMFLPDHPWIDLRLVALVCAAHWAWFLLLVQVLFEDQKLRPVLFAPAAAMFACDLVIFVASHAGNVPLVGAMHQLDNFGAIAALGWSIVVIARSWRGDLVARRRRLRWGVFAIGAGYSLVGIVLMFSNAFGEEAIISVDRWVNMILVLGAASSVLGLRPDLERNAAVSTSESAAGFSEASRLALMRLHTVMGKGEAWRRPGLAMEQLAAETGVSERQLRRLINERLGHTNFSAFLNSYRIEAAKAQLSDPLVSGTLADIAAGLGYASIATFNRAFKEATGQAPGAWRKATTGEALPATEPTKATGTT